MPLPNLAYHTINAFAPTPHGGNQAAVVLVPKDDPRAKDDKYMLTVAADFNLSETAYLVPLDDATVPVYSLRWFTPEIVGDTDPRLTTGSASVRARNARLGGHALQLRPPRGHRAALPDPLEGGAPRVP